MLLDAIERERQTTILIPVDDARFLLGAAWEVRGAMIDNADPDGRRKCGCL